MPPLAQAIEYYTYTDYKLWEGEWELINGVPQSITPSPSILYQTILAGISSELVSSLKKNKCSEYIKVGDFSLESYDFEDLECKASIDFASVFEKFRK